MSTMPAADLEEDIARLVRRLRGFSPRTWVAVGRRDAIRRLTADLVALGEPGHVLPDLPDSALGDIVAVLAREAVSYQESVNGRRDEVATAVRRALDETR